MGSFRTHIKVYRARFNLTQQELADAVGVRRETIVHLEQARYTPSLELAYRIARLFGVPIEQLFDFDE